MSDVEAEEETSSAVRGSLSFDLPEEVLQVLPSDPFEQLDVARKITSIALSTRVSSLESESSDLRELLAEKDKEIAELQSHAESLDASLSDALQKLSLAEDEKVRPVFDFWPDPTRFSSFFLIVSKFAGESGERELFVVKYCQETPERCL